MLFLACVTALWVAAAAHAPRPNLIFIIADDLGFNDVGFHGSNQVPTPNIDALAYSGLVLQNYYATPICTPSRAALMTGKYPIHTGMQHTVLYGAEPRGLPLSEKILPQYLKELGYRNHLVGKWHLGSYKREYLPLRRGFDSHLGFWTGKIDMYEHTTMERGSWGHDFRRGFKVADELVGKYVTDIYTDEAVRIIESHNTSEPLFLMVAHSAMHSGNPSEPLRAPDAVIDKFAHIEHTQRRKYAAMLTKLDESVGKVVASLQRRKLLANSILLFSTDNGGPAAGFNDNAASNYPLRGVKNTPFEGGIRAAGLLWSPLLKRRSRVASQMMHIVDWLPTLYSAVGGNTSDFVNIDGVDQWQALSEDQPSKRSSLVHTIDDIWGSASIALGEWKIIKGTNYDGQWDHWYGPSGREGTYHLDLVLTSDAAAAINKVDKMPDRQQITNIRESATVKCDVSEPVIACEPLKAPCLFNIALDPCERRNVAQLEPQQYTALLEELQRVNRTAVPPNNRPLDPRGDPALWGRQYTNFGDYLLPLPATTKICTG